MIKLRALIALLAVILSCSAIAGNAADTDALMRREITVGGTVREYLIFVPGTAAKRGPVPLVFVFHGALADARAIARTSRMHEIAKREGFIVAYPKGTMTVFNVGGNPPTEWAEQHNIDDVGFVQAVVAQIGSEYAIDKNRIFAAGISGGGEFVYTLACHTSLFAAVASIAGPMVDATCRPSRPVSVLHINGTSDWIVPFAARKTLLGQTVPTASEVVQYWARVAHCRGQLRQSSDPSIAEYGGCDAGRHIVLRLVRGGGHTWDQPGVNGSETIWEFFTQNGWK